MSVSTKIVQKMALQVQSGDSYEEDAMSLLPVLSGRIKQTPSLIEDESYTGNAFRDIPQRGTISVEGTISFQIDPVSLIPILEATLGDRSSGSSEVFLFTKHTKKLSVIMYDGVYTNKYANVYIKRFKINGSADNKLTGEVDVLGVTEEVRESGDTFPSFTENSDFFHFHEASSNGYLRVGDQSDTLTSSDEIEFDDFSIEMVTGFDSQFCNKVYSLRPVFGMSAPSVTGSFKISRYENDSFLDFSLNLTRLQANLLFYKSSSETIKFEIPNFIVNADLSDDDVTRIACEMTVGRNGIGSNYKNVNMAFTSPIRVTTEAS